MIKALLIVSALSGVGEYRIEMSSMESCMTARDTIYYQDSDIKTLCLPLETPAYYDGWTLIERNDFDRVRHNTD